MAESRLNNRGQLLIEAVVSISLMLVGMLGVFGVMSQSLGLSRVAADQYVAAHLAAEGVEIVKNVIDRDYDQGRGFGVSLAGGLGGEPYCRVDYETTSITPALCKSGSNEVPYLEFYAEEAGGSNDYGYGPGGRETKFRRYVYIEQEAPDIIKIRSVVEWVGRGGTDFDVTLANRFYNWRSAPPPPIP